MQNNNIILEPGFVVCDAPEDAELTFNRHKYLNRFLCWISPQSLNTSILNKQKTTNTTLPLRALTTAIANHVASLLNIRQVISSNKFGQQVEIAKWI